MSDFLRWFHGGERGRQDQPQQAGDLVRERIRFYGRVQGVGFRYRAVYAARDHACTGWVENELDGTVSCEVQGREEDIEKFLLALSDGSWIEITDMERERIPVEEKEKDFRVRGY